MELVHPRRLDTQVCRDPDDDNVLGTALAADCKCIITGDKDLLALDGHEGISIQSPRGFLTMEGLS
jgi:predicted nucleic acid-binding protein